MMNIKERIVQAKSEIPAVYIALKDKRTPLIAKILACITLVRFELTTKALCKSECFLK